MEYRIANYTTPDALIEMQNNVSKKIWSSLSDFQQRRSMFVHTRYREKEKNIVFCCKNCGVDLYGKFRFSDPQEASFIESQAVEQWKNAKDSFKPDEQEIEKRENTLKEAKEVLQLVQKDAENAKREYEKILRGSCPVCGAQLWQGKGFFLPDYDWFQEKSGISNYKKTEEMLGRNFGDDDIRYNSYDEKLRKISSIRVTEERKRASKEAAAYADGCNLPAAPAGVGAGKIKTDTDALKQYVLHLIQLENNIYALGQRLSELYYRRLTNNRKVALQIHEPVYQNKIILEDLRANYHKALEEVAVAEAYEPEISIQYPAAPAPPVLGKPGLFNKKKVLEENETLSAKYQADMKAYEEEVRRCDAEKARQVAEKRAAVMEKAKKEAETIKTALDETECALDASIQKLKEQPVPAKGVKELLDREIAEAEELMKKTFAARNELYACDVVFGKYRDVVALSSFYEYLMSGRCTSLEGADGAYNIYESEIRLNHVIDQLDVVISSLENIKQNQYMMYQELRNINASLSRLNSTMDKALTSIQSIETNTVKMNEYLEHISENSDVIAHNTAVTAYYSKVNAELTNALGYMVAFK